MSALIGKFTEGNICAFKVMFETGCGSLGRKLYYLPKQQLEYLFSMGDILTLKYPVETSVSLAEDKRVYANVHEFVSNAKMANCRMVYLLDPLLGWRVWNLDKLIGGWEDLKNLFKS